MNCITRHVSREHCRPFQLCQVRQIGTVGSILLRGIVSGPCKHLSAFAGVHKVATLPGTLLWNSLDCFRSDYSSNLLNLLTRFELLVIKLNILFNN